MRVLLRYKGVAMKVTGDSITVVHTTRVSSVVGRDAWRGLGSSKRKAEERKG